MLAEAGGEIEKLTADLKTLRNVESTKQTVEEEVNEVESDKEDDGRLMFVVLASKKCHLHRLFCC